MLEKLKKLELTNTQKKSIKGGMNKTELVKAVDG